MGRCSYKFPGSISAWLFLAMLLCSSTFADPGFYSIHDSQVPSDIRVASSGVFRILPQYVEPPLVPLDKSGEILNRLDDGYLKNLYTETFAECRKRRKDPCPVSTRASGSAFLLGDSRTLVTAAHVFTDEISAIFKRMSRPFETRKELRDFLVQLRTQSLKFVVRNADDQVLYDTANSPAKIYFVNRAQIRSWIEKDEKIRKDSFEREKTADKYLLGDIVVIRLEEAIPVSPLQLAANSNPAGGKIFYLGYPATEVSRDEFSAPGANGFDLNVTFGSKLPNFNLIDFANKLFPGVNIPKDETLNRFYRDRLWGTDLDASVGMSGGPALDINGDVIGVVTNASRLIDRREVFSFLAAAPYFKQQIEFMNEN